MNTLKLNLVEIDEKLLQYLPKNIEKIEFTFLNEKENNIFLKYLLKFKNLKILICKFVFISGVFLNQLSNLINKNIENIEIRFLHHSLTINPITYFSRLEKLKKFSINNEYNDCLDEPILIDNILQDILRCNNLQYLQIINNCKFNKSILPEFKKLPNFITAEVIDRIIK